MPLIIRKPAPPMVPFFTEVRRYLLQDTLRRMLFPSSWFGNDSRYLGGLRAFAANINPETITTAGLFTGLAEAGALNAVDVQLYEQRIRAGLVSFLLQINAADGKSVLMRVVRNTPEAVAPFLGSH